MEMSTISSESSYEKELECKEIIIQNPQWRPECCIYRVPKRLREVKKEAYTPRLISVGPLHRNIDASNEMEMLKQKYFQEFFHRTWKDRMEFENIVEKNEENIRHCYAAEISLPGKEDFVKMILLDSIFIIELFLRTATRQEYEKDDYILSKPWLDEGIKHDLILLENQLPFFILDELHHHIGRDISPQWRPECCIYRVPKRLREVKKEAYTPKLISVGPLHRNIDASNEMEMLKQKYFQEFFLRTWKDRMEFENIVKKNEENIRHCYAAEISLPGKEDFVKMILLDSIFIIELFLRTATRQEYEKDDYILSKPWLDEGIKHDLILLENQLPFFILDELHHNIGRSTSIHKSFINLACNYFFPGDQKKAIEKEVKHFTDLQRYFYLPRNLETGSVIEHLHSATKLDTAGLKFQVCKENQADKVLLDIQVEKPNLSENFPRFNCSWLLHCLPCLKCFWCLDCLQTRLVVPRFVINHGTEDLFRNLMALEQCHYPFEAYICNYIVLLDFLINTREDAELLVEKKIIAHSLGSYKAVAQMVNKLGQEIVEKNSCYHEVAKDLNEHYGNWWNKNIASLRTVYFRDVWRGTATFVGIVVLFVTIGNFLWLLSFTNKFP